jgi:hypothetical protein
LAIDAALSSSEVRVGSPVGDLIVVEKAKSADVFSLTAGADFRKNDGGPMRQAKGRRLTVTV